MLDESEKFVSLRTLFGTTEMRPDRKLWPWNSRHIKGSEAVPYIALYIGISADGCKQWEFALRNISIAAKMSGRND